MMKLTELADRVERLTGPCRETDYLICEAVHPFLAQYGYQRTEGDSGYYSATPSIKGAEKIAPASGYTASLDAAMTLVPEGLPILVRDGYDDAPGDKRPYAHVMNEIGEGYAATKALAVVVASLRARAASESSHG